MGRGLQSLFKKDGWHQTHLLIPSQLTRLGISPSAELTNPLVHRKPAGIRQDLSARSVQMLKQLRAAKLTPHQALISHFQDGDFTWLRLGRPRSYQSALVLTILTTDNITGTSIKTPTTVASAAPDCRPNRLIAAATESSKKLLAPIKAEGPATQCCSPSRRLSR